MNRTALTARDEDEIRRAGLSVDEVKRQLDLFAQGPAPVTLDRPCIRGDGISVIDGPDEERFIRRYEDALREQTKAAKFVPASGAASRMFKEWFDMAVSRNQEPHVTARFFRDLPRYAFYRDLEAAVEGSGVRLDSLAARRSASEIIEHILTPKGLNLGRLPKALIPFHRYPGGNRTALEEHFVDGALLIAGGDKTVRIHVTLSEEHYDAVAGYVERLRPRYEKAYGVSFDITLSVQSHTTDTIAVDDKNGPLRDGAGSLVFRPAGHGALLGNLQKTKGDIIFISNIDNVVPDHLKDNVIRHRKMLGGIFMEMQDRIFRYLRLVRSGTPTGAAWREIAAFCTDELSRTLPGALAAAPTDEAVSIVTEMLDRPLRVCGMVRNEGEPGGGPFWVRERNGSRSLQIVEKAQIDNGDPVQRAIWNASTHFNPVDIVCGIRDQRGDTFALTTYTDPATFMISEKSLEGRTLKALELPGLWNGAMARWNTVFVEVPASTFNPVKTVADLLRTEHAGMPLPE